MKPFDESTEHLSNYLERLDLYMEANDVPEEKRTATLLSLLGAKHYSSLRDSLDPVKPSDKSYSELKEMLKAPEPMEMKERFTFYRRSQKHGESVSDFVDELKRLTRFCNFGTFEDEAVRDRLVCGVSDPNIQKKLLGERTLTLESAVVIAGAMEKEAQAMRHGGMGGAMGVDRRGLRGTPREKTCFVCGEPGHIKQDCQHKSAACERCGRSGHIVRMCRVPLHGMTPRTVRNKMKPGAPTPSKSHGDNATDLEHKDEDGRNCEELAGRRTAVQPYNSRHRQHQQPRGKVPQDYDYFLILDFESTCDDKKKFNPQEIIEFPVLKLSATTYEVEGTFHHFVRPTKHPTLTQFCTHLTSITQEEVDNGKVFEDVFADFDQWMKEEVGLDKRFLFVTCGDWDLKTMLPNQCSTSDLQVPSYCKKWLNIKKAYALMTGEYNRGMMAMINGLGLKHQGRHHRGLDDCHNIGNILKELAERGCKFLHSMNVE